MNRFALPLALLALVTALLAACSPGETVPPSSRPKTPSASSATEEASPSPSLGQVTIWAPYLAFLEQQTLTDNAAILQEVNLFWYELAADGRIQGAVQSPQGLRAIREAGLRVVPSIVNGGFDRARVAAIIHDPERRAAHIQEILALVQAEGYDGIDIDYESLLPEDREAFSLFIEELAAGLHQEGKLLSIAVHAKTAEPGEWEGAQAQDWARLGAAVDEFKIMTYDYHHGASPAGPIAPLAWVDRVLRFAATQVPPQKTFMGVHFYGYDWIGSHGESINWRQAMKIAERNQVQWQRDVSGEAWFRYGPDGRHTVYVADAQGLRLRLRTLLARHPDLAGIAIWSLGGEDPENWSVLRTFSQAP